MIYEDWGGGSATLYGQIVEYEPSKTSISIGPGGIGEAAFNSRNIDVIEPDGKDGSIYKKTLLCWGAIPEETA